MHRLIAFFLDRSLLVNLVSVGILIAGTLFLWNARREAFPRVDFDWVLINTIYPGATAEDVETLVTIPIEDQLREVDGIEQLNSSSLENLSSIGVQLDPDLEDKTRTINDIKNAVDKASDLPEDSEEPEVIELNSAMSPILEIAVINKAGLIDSASERQLREFAHTLEQRLLEIEGVARIEKAGYRDREMIVEVQPRLLDEYNIAVNDIVFALSRKNLNFPGGLIKHPDGEILIRTIGEVDSVSEIEDVMIRANDRGNWVTVGDVATVRDGFEEEKLINKSRGQKAIMLTVIKKESGDIITTVNHVRAVTESFQATLPENYSIDTFGDLSYFVQRRLDVLVSNGIVGFILVLLSLFFTLGWRISVVTALGIPLAFFATFLWMASQGVTVNLMSMFGLIMVLGMVVDDAIIVAENVYRHLEAGVEIHDAVIRGTSEVILPVAATILTTIAAFSPLMFMSGIMGKFMWVLPAVVSVALIFSWLECMFILPSHIKDVEKLSQKHLRPGPTNQKTNGRLLIWFRRNYERVLRAILARKYTAFLAGIVLFTATGVFSYFFTKFVLFPQGNIEILVIKAEAATGTRVQSMSEHLGGIENVIAELPDSELDAFTTLAGAMMEDPGDPFAKIGSNYGIIKVFLTPANDRERDAVEILNELRTKNASAFEQFKKLEFGLINQGPPVGKPISVTIKGEEFETLAKIAQEYKTYLQEVPGLKEIKDDYEGGKNLLHVHVDEKTAAIAGITVFDVASTLRSAYEGTVATTIKKSDEEIDIRVIFPEKLRESVESLDKIKVANRLGNLIPFNRVASVKEARGLNVISRRDWRRTITVTADIDENARGVSSVSVNRMLIQKFEDLEQRYPTYTVSYEGEFKDTEESVNELVKSFAIAAIVIYTILVAMFRSLVRPLVVMGVIPLTFLGLVWIFYFHGLPLSFLALLGVVGLTGVVVNDSIVLVDFIQREQKEGVSVFEATVQAGVTRLRPVFLTTITTFLGLIPTAYGIGGFDPFLKPMAVSLSWGLAFGTVITLIGTPTLYLLFADLYHRITGREYV